MRYLMFVATDTDGEQRSDDLLPAWLADVDGRGKRVVGDRLRPAADATTVWVRKGELLVTDGPFTESKDWISRSACATGRTPGWLDRVAAAPELDGYHLLPAARADFARRLGRTADAVTAYTAALRLARTEPDRRFLRRRLEALG